MIISISKGYIHIGMKLAMELWMHSDSVSVTLSFQRGPVGVNQEKELYLLGLIGTGDGMCNKIAKKHTLM